MVPEKYTDAQIPTFGQTTAKNSGAQIPTFSQSPKKYTDAEMAAFSQIAYMKDLPNAFKAQHKGEPIRLGNLLTENEHKMLEGFGIKREVYNKWELVDVHDTNNFNGFYCCTIKTDKNQAAVAFRGSESSNLGDFVNDWGLADLRLLNSVQTRQQQEIHHFLKNKNDVLSQYNLAMTGHSLGGDLADYATIVSGNYGLADNIFQHKSLDGPGLSMNCIVSNALNVIKMSPKMEHVKWSLVGNLLNPIPGVKQRVGDVRHISEEDQYNIVTRHKLEYLKFEKDGSISKGKTDWLSNILGPASQIIDTSMFSPFRPFYNRMTILFNKMEHGAFDLGQKFGAEYKKLFSDPDGKSPSGGGGGSSGSANVIKVSTEDMAKTVSQYLAEKKKLIEAIDICNNAAKTLAQSWAGPSFRIMSIKLADTYGNLMQSMEVIDDAVSELRKTIEIMDSTEKKIKASFAALETGTSPFI